jgi:hypothetical protein
MLALMTAARRRLDHIHNENVWLAWHIAALDRQKRLPRMQSLMNERRRKPQTWREQMSICRSIAAAFGSVH